MKKIFIFIIIIISLCVYGAYSREEMFERQETARLDSIAHVKDSIRREDSLSSVRDSIWYVTYKRKLYSMIKDDSLKKHYDDATIDALLGWFKSRYYRYDTVWFYPITLVGFKESPDHRYVFLATFLETCGSGRTSGYQFFKYDRRTAKSTYITDCAALGLWEGGVDVQQGRCLNPDDFAFQQVWRMHSEYYNWKGERVSVSKKEISEKRMIRIFDREYDKLDDHKKLEKRNYLVKDFTPCPVRYTNMRNEPGI